MHYEDHAAAVTVTVGTGAGNDGNAQDGAAGSRDTVSNTEAVIGTAADDSLSGDGSANTLTGGGGNDVLARGRQRTLDGGAGANTASYGDHSAPVTVNLADAGADGAAGEQDTLVAIRDLVGGTGDDTLVGDGAANVIFGGGGKDIVIGQAGGDHLFGEAGDDDVRAKDNETDNVDCGEGADKASLDDIDLATACDDSTITVVDVDGDGAPYYLDCDDTNPSIRPGAVDVPGDGIDQDCAGGDARVDADGDGSSASRTATTPTPRSSRERSRSTATPSTRTATGSGRRSRSSTSASARTTGTSPATAGDRAVGRPRSGRRDDRRALHREREGQARVPVQDPHDEAAEGEEEDLVQEGVQGPPSATGHQGHAHGASAGDDRQVARPDRALAQEAEHEDHLRRSVGRYRRLLSVDRRVGFRIRR